jgi:hypothetical protein
LSDGKHRSVRPAVAHHLFEVALRGLMPTTLPDAGGEKDANGRTRAAAEMFGGGPE